MNMPLVRYIAALLLLTMMVGGCATQYQSRRFGGGFSDTRLGSDMFRVSFNGNAFTSMERTQDFTMLRAAELTAQYGYSHFIIQDGTAGYSTSSYTTPVQVDTTSYSSLYGSSTGSVSGHVSSDGYYGGSTTGTYSGSYTGHATTTISGGDTHTIHKPGATILIQCFADTLPPGQHTVYDASFLLDSLRTKYNLHESD